MPRHRDKATTELDRSQAEAAINSQQLEATRNELQQLTGTKKTWVKSRILDTHGYAWAPIFKKKREEWTRRMWRRRIESLDAAAKYHKESDSIGRKGRGRTSRGRGTPVDRGRGQGQDSGFTGFKSAQLANSHDVDFVPDSPSALSFSELEVEQTSNFAQL